MVFDEKNFCFGLKQKTFLINSSLKKYPVFKRENGS